MPQLSITAFAKVFTSLAGRKRRINEVDQADESEGYDSEEIEVSSIRPRPALQTISPLQAQNKRRRVLDCVLIPGGKSKLKQSAMISASLSSARSVHVAGTGELSASARSRPVTSSAVDQDTSDDELLAPTRRPTTKRTFSRANPIADSDFKQPLSDSEFDAISTNPSDSDSSEASLDQTSDDDEKVRSARIKSSTRRPTSDSAPVNAGARNKSTKGTAKMMTNLIKREISLGRGLDLSLPPLHRIEDMFADMTAKAFESGLDKVLQHFEGKQLRVATMCSGTESPFLALEMIRDSLKRLSYPDFVVDHAFSAEIVPFKQAYIERNFNPPLIFRDITELTEAVKDEVPMATTAYGSKAEVPTDIHMVIAGTSCVDFSGLNKHKKTLEDDGESSKTWEAVFSFCSTYKSPIVLIENIRGAEWDRMQSEYRSIGYETAGVHVDTKNYYLPQTRERGYMVCFDTSGTSKSSAMGQKWQSLMSKFQRNCSSPASSFLLPTSKLSNLNQSVADDAKREIDWARCAERHVRYRQDKRLGNKRPLTFWQESGSMIVPEHGNASWYHNQVERVLDLMDCRMLGKASAEMYDVRFKTRIWNVSQNVDLHDDTAPFGISTCITPTGNNVASDSGRALSAQENLILQGIPLSKISLTTETPSQLQDLAGNAMSSTAIGAAILSALLTGYHCVSHFPEPRAPSTACVGRRAHINDSKETLPTTISYDHDFANVPFLLDVAQRAIRRCFCEGERNVTKKDLQRCCDCNHTTCTACGGNPQHNYRPHQSLSKGRLLPQGAEGRVRSKLPWQVKFAHMAEAIKGLRKLDGSSKMAEKYLDLVKKASGEVYSLHSFQRGNQLAVTFQSGSGQSYLNLILHDHHANWELFAHPPKELAANDPLRKRLQRPVASSRVSISLFDGQWTLATPLIEKADVTVRGHGGEVPTWWARLGLPDFRKHTQPRYLTIEAAEEKRGSILAQLQGTYEYLPRCGTACDSLYKRVKGGPSQGAMFLFLDPTRVGSPADDCFVFSQRAERLDYHETRSIIAQIQASWRPWEQGQTERTVSLHMETNCIATSSRCALRPLTTSVVLQEPINHDPAGDKWNKLELCHANQQCIACAPKKPELKWKLSYDGEAIQPYEDSSSAAEYERAIKQRPLPLSIEAKFSGDSRTNASLIRLGADLASMGHRVRAQLPWDSHEVAYSWRLRTHSNLSNDYSFKPFILKPLSKISPYTGRLNMEIELFPNQQRSLNWMVHQERGNGRRFYIEQSLEERVDHLGWALEMRAQMPIHVRGGICADHPGYGKTIISLALVQKQWQEQGSSGILHGLSKRQDESTLGLEPSTATLITCPWTLVDQWAEEARDKLGFAIGTDILIIKRIIDLDKMTLDKLSRAKLVVISIAVLGSEQYTDRLAAFAGIPGPAAAKGRAFEKWLECALDVIPENLKILQQSGPSQLWEHVERSYSRNVNSEQFKAAVPSRRLRGKDYVAAQKAKSNQSRTKLPAPKALDASLVGKSLLHMFFFNRVICDEFQNYDSQEMAIVRALRRDRIWGLSGTPPITDFYDVNKMGQLLGIDLPIGAYSRGVMKQKNIRNASKEMTDFERFDSMREPVSPTILARTNELLQGFLDEFVTRNLTDFKVDYHDHLVPVSLDLGHRAIYAEVSQYLNSIEMRLKKGSKTKTTDREERLDDAIGTASSAEEALSKLAAYSAPEEFVPHSSETGLGALIKRRRLETLEREAGLHTAIREAEKYESIVFEQWRQGRLHLDVLGDQETLELVIKSCSRSEKESKALAATKLKTGAKHDRSRGLTSAVNALLTRLLVSKRSLRFVESLDRIRSTKHEQLCANTDCRSYSLDSDVGVSAFCGHIVCEAGHQRNKETGDLQCQADSCYAEVNDHDIIWRSRIKNLESSKKASFGAKIDAAAQLLQTIRKNGDQAVLFVQYDEQLDQVNQALQHQNIPAAFADEVRTANKNIDEFKSNNEITAMVLNASDETATGLNLQNANHVIFLSPLLRDQQYAYEATMAQAIGRVRRHGQKKQIHVYRIVALDTIDVDILEHREKRSNAITERGAPRVQRPSSPEFLAQATGEPRPERTQLVRENGAFSLRPQSWLVRCGADEDEAELEKVRSQEGSRTIVHEQRVKMKGRVMGWQNFSSLIKFSRAFTEDDD